MEALAGYSSGSDSGEPTVSAQDTHSPRIFEKKKAAASRSTFALSAQTTVLPTALTPTSTSLSSTTHSPAAVLPTTSTPTATHAPTTTAHQATTSTPTTTHAPTTTPHQATTSTPTTTHAPTTTPHQATTSTPTTTHAPTTTPHQATKAPGAYVSKKRKAEAALPPHACSSSPALSNSQLRPIPDVPEAIRGKPSASCLPQRVKFRAREHTGAVNCVRFSKPYGHLLASASMDSTVRVWDVCGSSDFDATSLRTFRDHTGAVRDVQWNFDGTHLLSASFDTTARLTNVETGVCIHSFRHKEFVTAVQVHPSQHDLFLAGGSKHGIVCWDIRSRRIVKEYSGFFGQVQDIQFLPDGSSFISSCDITKRNSYDKTLVVWDFSTGVVLSNQVFLEAFSCPSVRVHPFSRHFCAQTNGNYIAIFSTKPPYKMDKHKRFEGHRVSGYNIGFGFSPDGRYLTSGSTDGKLRIFDWHSVKVVKTLNAFPDQVACVDACYHPRLPSTVATCGWDGGVAVYC